MFSPNEKVQHIFWGEGKVIKFDGETVTIQFEKIGLKKLALPMVIEKKLIKLSDDERQLLLVKQIKENIQKKENNLKNKTKAQRKKEESNVESRAKSKAIQTNNIKSRQNNQDMISIDDLKTGCIYTNEELRRAFKVSPQGGMRKSNITNSLVLISKHSKNMERNPYEDRWHDDGCFHYTGMGLYGDQSLEYMQNKTLTQSNKNGVSVYLFECYTKNEYTYRGRVILASKPYTVNEKDADTKMRRVYKFPLKIVN